MQNQPASIVCAFAAAIALLCLAACDPAPRNHPGDAAAGGAPQTQEAGEGHADGPLDFTVDAIDGTPVNLDSYRGDVLLIVNVASRCGLTPQYEALEALYRERKDQGFAILGFPANNFNGQEPGTNEEISTFCRSKYDVTFPMFSKLSVRGDDQHPLYTYLSTLPEPLGGDPAWNFTKFLVDREGRVVARFEPRTTPNDPAVLRAIDELIAHSAG